MEIFIDDILDKEKTVDLFQKAIEKWMKKKVSE